MPIAGLFALLWNFWQQSEIDEQEEKTKSLDEQVQRLRELHAKHHELLRKMLVVLEREVGQDIDADGSIGELLRTPESTPGVEAIEQTPVKPDAQAGR